MRCALLTCILFSGGCVSTIVGTTADIAIEAVKVPFKVGSAVVDAVSSDDEGEADQKKNDENE